MDVQPVGATPATQDAPQIETPQSSKPIEPATLNGSESDGHTPLSSTIAKLFGSGSPDDSAALAVSYRIEKPNEIVTVFSDPVTGKEIVQFPAEAMVQIAQFFDKSSGVTLDKNA